MTAASCCDPRLDDLLAPQGPQPEVRSLTTPREQPGPVDLRLLWPPKPDDQEATREDSQAERPSTASGAELTPGPFVLASRRGKTLSLLSP